MKRTVVPLMFCLLVCAPLAAQAQPDTRELEGPVPHNIKEALGLLHRDAFDEAEKQIVSGSRSPANGNLAAMFRSNRDQDGQYQGFDVISSQAVTPRIRILYIALEYEKAPHLLKLTLYRTADGWALFGPVTQPLLEAFDTVPMNGRQSAPAQ